MESKNKAMKAKWLLAPSVLSADFGNLQGDIEMLNKSEADWIHIDVMDGVFVPNISFGFPVIKSIKKSTEKPLDVHLMIVKPERFIRRFADAGADILTIHYEACTHLHKAIHEIKELGIKAGVVLNPHTAVSVLENIICDLDLVLIMSVNPGFAAQEFISGTYDKIASLKKMIASKNPKCLIEVDGGVSLKNAEQLLSEGADILVAGNSIFSTSDPVKTILQFKQIYLS
jgi:ribulose-phosphate 3-epimerase